ncbi:hypothetical protein MYRNA_245 [Mycobacterium phage Myrna]|uniref:Uncharacterized protein n=1 Tax=Mycobacterium phage Myrna TaxID=546805 RepID=B5LJL5_9CAUD|nr:gp245 [Mycobacterium phage Myrna]ACH62212.1 hypothetical protein MYRNA_245 [Mycobacterium phage Myrna]
MSLPWERGLRPPPAPETDPEPAVQYQDESVSARLDVEVPSQAPADATYLPSGVWISKEDLGALRDHLLAEGKEYGVDVLKGTLSGQEIDHARPTVTVTTNQGKEIRIADAKNRSFRTLLQGFALDVVFALVTLFATLSGNEFFSKAGLAALGILVAKTVLQTAISYLTRINIEPTIKTPEGKAALVPVNTVKPFVLNDGERVTRVSIAADPLDTTKVA